MGMGNLGGGECLGDQSMSRWTLSRILNLGDNFPDLPSSSFAGVPARELPPGGSRPQPS